MAELRDVSDTARWMAAYRAEESERPDALFSDPYARRLAGAYGFELLDAMPNGRKAAWPIVIRTVLFDRAVTEAVAHADLVLNLAAGLDARPYRMALPPSLTWIEVDLPAIVDHKTELLASENPVCRLERKAADLSDAGVRRRVLAEAGARSKHALVLTEGLLVYLDRADVEALATDLAAVPSMRSWVADICSPGLLKMISKTWGEVVGKANAPFRFAPEEGPDFFTAHGWRVASTWSSFQEAAKRMRLPFPLSLFALFPEPKTWNPKRMWGGTVLLERSSSILGTQTVLR